MTVPDQHVAPVTLTGSFTQGSLNCLAHFFTQNLKKGHISPTSL